MSGTGGGLPAPVIPAIGAVPGQSYRLSPRAVRDRMRERLLGDAQRSLRAALSAELAKPPRITQVDAVLFTGGVLNLCLTEVVFLLWPAKLGLWFTGWTLPLMAWRYHSYKKQKWHYFLIDMCYLVNWLCLLHLWVFPDSPLLFEVSFSLASGPVAWAILAWRNALVFHSVGKWLKLAGPWPDQLQHHSSTAQSCQRHPCLSRTQPSSERRQDHLAVHPRDAAAGHVHAAVALQPRSDRLARGEAARVPPLRAARQHS